MRAKLPMLFVFVTALGCSARTPVIRQATSSAPVPAGPAADQTPPAPPEPAETLADADRAYDSRLGASRGQFDVEWQVAVLKQAVLLYGEFLARAVGRPELDPAVRKSRERIADAQATIVFLEATRRGEPPPDSTD